MQELALVVSSLWHVRGLGCICFFLAATFSGQHGFAGRRFGKGHEQQRQVRRGAAASHLPRDDKNQVMGKRAWWKAIVRPLGKKGQGLHAEIRGTTDKEVQDRAKEFYHI